MEDLVDAAFESFAEDNVRYVELRNSPFNISYLNRISTAEAVEWLVSAVNQSSQKWAVEAGLILSVDRQQQQLSIEKAWDLFSAIKANSVSRTILGMDVAGDETFNVDPSISKVFCAVKDLGLQITIHAGEQGSTDNIWWAINECGADRIGHGLAAQHDKKLLRTLSKKNICVEVCLQSNLLSGQVQSRHDHPVFREFIEYDVPFVVCSDNPAVHDQSLSSEYFKFFQTGRGHEAFEQMLRFQKEFAFSQEKFDLARISSDTPEILDKDPEFAVMI